MNSLLYRLLGKKTLAAVVMAAFAMGLSLTPSSFALADGDDDRFVIVKGAGYEVRHDGKGPHIRFDGQKHYLQGEGSFRYVVVSGVKYNVLGDDDDDDDHDHDHKDRKHRHHHHDDDDDD